MRYTKIAKAEPFVGLPRITNPTVFGASPKKPIVLRIGAIGQRPMTYGAENLPEGTYLDGCAIYGSVAEEGEYKIKLVCENGLGRCERESPLK